MLRIYEDMKLMLRDVRPMIEVLAKRDSDLADQMRRAAQSVVLNCGEGCYSRGKRADAHFQVSMASMRETLSCIEVGIAFGYFKEPDAAVMNRIDKIIATLYRLVRG